MLKLMHARVGKLYERNAKAWNDDREHAIERKKNEVVVSIGVPAVIARMRMHLAQHSALNGPSCSRHLPNGLFVHKDTLWPMPRSRYYRRKKDGFVAVLNADPVDDSFVSSVINTTKRELYEDIASYRYQVLGQ